MAETQGIHDEADDNREALRFYGDRAGVLIASVASFVVASAIVIGVLELLPQDTAGFERGLVLSIGVLLFGGLGALGIGTALSQEPLLRATRDGLFFSSVGARIGLVPWAQIESFMIFNRRGKRILLIRIRPSLALFSQPFPVTRPQIWLGWIALRSAGSLAYGEGSFRMSLQEVVEQLRQRFGKELHQHHVKIDPGSMS